MPCWGSPGRERLPGHGCSHRAATPKMTSIPWNTLRPSSCNLPPRNEQLCPSSKECLKPTCFHLKLKARICLLPLRAKFDNEWKYTICIYCIFITLLLEITSNCTAVWKFKPLFGSREFYWVINSLPYFSHWSVSITNQQRHKNELQLQINTTRQQWMPLSKIILKKHTFKVFMPTGFVTKQKLIKVTSLVILVIFWQIALKAFLTINCIWWEDITLQCYNY